MGFLEGKLKVLSRAHSGWKWLDQIHICLSLYGLGVFCFCFLRLYRHELLLKTKLDSLYSLGLLQRTKRRRVVPSVTWWLRVTLGHLLNRLKFNSLKFSMALHKHLKYRYTCKHRALGERRLGTSKHIARKEMVQNHPPELALSGWGGNTALHISEFSWWSGSSHPATRLSFLLRET